MSRWREIARAPHNLRVIVYGPHAAPATHDEMAMAWLDRLDNQWYYAPQGGLLADHGWQPTHWMPLPEDPTQ